MPDITIIERSAPYTGWQRKLAVDRARSSQPS
jgi:hypothetical protein